MDFRGEMSVWKCLWQVLMLWTGYGIEEDGRVQGRLGRLWHYISHWNEQSISYVRKTAEFGRNSAQSRLLMVKMG